MPQNPFRLLRQRISLKISLFVAFFVFLFLFALGLYFTFYIYAAVESKFGLALEHIAITAALQIDGDAHAEIQSAQSRPFQKIRSILKRVRDANGLSAETIYTFRKASRQSYAFVVMTHAEPFVGDIYHPPAATQKIIQMAFEGKSGYTPLYRDSHGEWISGYAPIYAKSGKVTGILAVDFKVDRFLEAARLDVWNFLAVGLFLIIFLVVFSYVLGKKISEPIVAVSQAARRLEKGDYSYRLPDKSSDETGQLIRSFNALSSTLQERFDLLKYVSPHTLEMIRLIRSGQISADGELRKVAILFSDIRGYTRYTESHDPKTVVETLNQMLGLEARIITKCGGQIDKFVGDEVVAIFSGENSVASALEAAGKIRMGMEELGISNGDEGVLHVGIGLSYGEVVFGNIGSEDRKDFTITGQNVNLAARLCSAAKEGEILASSHILYELQQSAAALERFPLKLKGKARIKGFQDLMHVYYLP